MPPDRIWQAIYTSNNAINPAQNYIQARVAAFSFKVLIKVEFMRRQHAIDIAGAGSCHMQTGDRLALLLQDSENWQKGHLMLLTAV